jgi:hypothetical protein
VLNAGVVPKLQLTLYCVCAPMNSSPLLSLCRHCLLPRVYSPVAFGKKTDPTGDFIRKYVPQLAGIPDRWIYGTLLLRSARWHL